MPPVSLLIKPASGLCNLRCRYCFYTDEMNKRQQASYGVMSRETLRAVLEKAFRYADGQVTLAFQGGEPTMAGLDFFRDVVAYAAEYNTKKLPIQYAIQTNGILLDESWAVFLRENHFLVGLSLDGTEAIHNSNRVDPAGRGTFQTVLDRARLLQEHEVSFNILTVVTRQTAGSIGKIYRFFRERNLPWQQYIPCLDPLGDLRGGQPYSLTPEKYEHFLKVLFDNWYRDVSAGKFSYNRYFENLLGMLLGSPPENCGMRGHCSIQHVVEADGSVYPCDFYVLDEYCLGNLVTDSFEQVQQSRRALDFLARSGGVHEKCRSCQWYPLCRGGCRRDREQPDGTIGLNYFCSAYEGFFQYAYPRLRQLAQQIRTGRR